MNLRRDVFQAIADPTRRAILLLVTSHSMTAGAIANHFDSARPTVSKHLQILTECELLKQDRRAGKYTTILMLPNCGILLPFLIHSANAGMINLTDWQK